MKKIVVSIVVVLTLLIAALVVSTYFYQLMLVQGESMVPTIKNRELVIVDKHSGNYQSGDIIAFTHSDIKGVLVKRIVAVGCDTVQITDGMLYVNGEISDCQIDGLRLDYSGLATEEIYIPEGYIFVLGDNYEMSKDSRYEEIGLIDIDDVIGRVIE